MWHIVVFLIGLAAASSLPLEDILIKHHAEWQKFTSQFEKKYGSNEEELKRFKIFEANSKLIEEHNERYAKGLESYEMKLNHFADMTREESMKYRGFRPDLIRKNKNMVTFLEPMNVEVPASVDWRDKGLVTPVKDQGACGSCWAFSSTGSLEGQLKRKSGELVSLSEQNLVDCSSSYGNYGCNGGLMEYAFQYVIENDGIDTEVSYPYEGRDKSCRYKNTTIGTTQAGFVSIPEGDEEMLKKAVATIGPISVAIDVTDNFQFYSGQGVFYDYDCSSYNLNHAVLVVGYGTDTTGKDYWIVKNSWGAWGDKGYILMSRNRDNNCGIASMSIFPTL